MVGREWWKDRLDGAEEIQLLYKRDTGKNILTGYLAKKGCNNLINYSISFFTCGLLMLSLDLSKTYLKV